MGNGITFDTLATAKRFKAAGMSEEQAEVISEVMKEFQEARLRELATKGDLQLEIEKIRKEIAEAKNEILKWVVGLMLAQTGLIVAAIRLIPGH